VVVVPDPGATVHALRDAQHSGTLSTSSHLETNWCSSKHFVVVFETSTPEPSPPLFVPLLCRLVVLHCFGSKVVNVTACNFKMVL